MRQLKKVIFREDVVLNELEMDQSQKYLHCTTGRGWQESSINSDGLQKMFDMHTCNLEHESLKSMEQ